MNGGQDPSQPQPATPPPPPPETQARGTTNVRVRRPTPATSTPPPVVAQPTPAQPTPAQPTTPVPVQTTQLSLVMEPNVGPVQTSVRFVGDLPARARMRGLEVRFSGASPVRATRVTRDSFYATVPSNAQTGPVEVSMGGRVLWTGGPFRVVPSDSGLLVPVPVARGLTGKVYRLNGGTQRLPDLGAQGQPFATIVVPNLAVNPRRFSEGFPGIAADQGSLVEWFAIRFEGTIEVPAGGAREFKLFSDDGSVLYIDGQKVIDHDGLHVASAKTAQVQLSPGKHKIVVDYFQGPRYYIALELHWRGNAQEAWQIVPPEALSR